MKRLVYLLALGCLLTAIGCARMGSPDGGWYDDDPPRVIGASPADQAVNVDQRKITIYFDEYIKLADPTQNVIVSPPQLEMPEIKSAGKKIVVELQDSLKPNTTYTIDFSDAITDNNEDNPMGNYTFTFSTGERIDTFEVGGYVLDASNLEPVKGISVGLYDNLSDTVFRKEPLMRISRTDGTGHFVIKGVAPGEYRVYALQDADGNFIFSQKSEMIAFSHEKFTPTAGPDIRQDTIWRDTLHIENILRVGYTHFLPDDVTLLCFQEPQTDRFLLKTERQEPEKIGFFFSYGHEEVPRLRGLNFDSDSAFVVETSLKRDTVYYWLRDTTLVNQDTLRLEANYYMSDSLGTLFLHTDTMEILPKVGYEKRKKDEQKEYEKWKKEQEKKKKREERYDSIMPVKPLQVKVTPMGQVEPMQTVWFETPQPLQRCDTSGVHLYVQIDSVWYNAPHEFTQHSARKYALKADWQEGLEYSLEIDSAAFCTIYGLENARVKQGLKVSEADKFSTLTVELSGLPPLDSVAVVRVALVDKSDKVVRESVMEADGSAVFFYLKPSTYYLRLHIDQNGNGEWDTGCYDEGRQAEPVYYFNEEVECKEKWDVNRKWNLTTTPRYRQKPAAVTKQKPEKARQQKNRNLERAKQMGIEYLKGKGVSL